MSAIERMMFPQQEGSKHQEKLDLLKKMEAEYGFMECEQMIALAKQFVDEPQNRPALCGAWIDLAQEQAQEVRSNHPEQENQILFGMYLAQARMYLSAGLMEFYDELIQEQQEFVREWSDQATLSRLWQLSVRD